MAVWDRITSLIAGEALARSAGSALDPAFETTRQRAWGERAVRTLDPAAAAELNARAAADKLPGIDLRGVDPADDAKRHGVGINRYELMTDLARSHPGLGEAIRLRRRQLAFGVHVGISEAEFQETLRRQGFTRDAIGWIADLVQEPLSVAETAAAVQQGHLPNTSPSIAPRTILPELGAAVPAVGGQVTADAPDGGEPSSVPLTQIELDPVAQAEASGTSFAQLQVAANLSGLPPGSDLLLNMWNRELIDEASVDAGIREGHMKTKWAQAYKRLRWNVLGAAEYASAHLRGWITETEMYKGGKLTGHTKAQMDLLYLNRGRPMAPGQSFTAAFRPAPSPYRKKADGSAEQFGYQDFKRAIQQSDVRTEYVDTLWAIRHAYPSLFQLGRLASAGALPRERVQTILRYERYEEQDIQGLLDFWYAGAAAKPDPHLAKAETQLWTAAHRSYLTGELTDRDATVALEAAGVAADKVPAVLGLWAQEANLARKMLTAAQIKRAYQKAALNAATAQPWTRDEAIAALQARGYPPLEANDYLNIP